MLQKNKSRNHAKGELYEEIASEYLLEQGYEILERHYRFHRNEIDIIAYGEGCYVFTEVKSRSSKSFGFGFQAVDQKKQESIRKVAQDYLFRRKLSFYDTACRFDVISIDAGELRHFKNAF